MVTAIAKHDGASSRLRALLTLLDTLGPSDFPEVIAALEKSGLSDLRESEYKLLFASWAEVAPEDAMAYASNLFEGNLAQNTILETWATQAPEMALAWAKENYASPNADLANPWLLNIVKGAAPENLDLALSIVEDMPYGSKGRQEALGVVLSHLHAQDPEQAAGWVETIEDKEFQAEAIDLLAKSIITSDPENGFEQVLALNGGAPLERLGQEIAHYRYLDDPEGTKDWVATLPEIGRGPAAHAVVSHTAKEDPIATAQWMADLLASQPDGYYQDAIRTLVEDTTLVEPQVAAEWITALNSTQEQGRYYQEVISEWLEKDPVSAQDWVVYNYQDMPEHVLTRFFPDFVPEIDPHNRDESAMNQDTPK